MENKDKKKYIITKEKRKEYNDNYMKNHQELIYATLICKVCEAKYTYFNKSRHNKSQRHIYSVKIQKLQNLIK